MGKMKELKKSVDKVTHLYSFETEDPKRLDKLYEITHANNGSIKEIFVGTKSELLEKNEDWCKKIVEGDEIAGVYLDCKFQDSMIKSMYYNFTTAKESLSSLLETIKEEFIIITEERL
jgi:hypothetical protein